MTRPPDGAPGDLVRTRRSAATLAGIAAAAVVLLYLTDGLAAAGTGVAVIAVAGLAVGRYAAGAGAQDGGYRKAVRLLDGRAPALGEWQRIVDRSLGDEGDLHFATTLRPQLQRLFAARLAERHGVALRRDPQRARALVGPELWPWIDPAAAAAGAAAARARAARAARPARSAVTTEGPDPHPHHRKCRYEPAGTVRTRP